MTCVSTVNNMADSDDDVPPLEDMSEVLRQVSAIQDQRTTSATKPLQEVTSDCGRDAIQTNSKTKPPGPTPKENGKDTGQKPSGFGGMKKGFLFGSPSPKKPKSVTVQDTAKTSKDDIPLITAKDPSSKESQYKMPEVQQAMGAASGLLQNKDWINDDLLDNICKNETLMKQLADPKFMNAMAEFQTDSAAATAKYQGNREIQTFIRDFCGVLGGHFTKLADQSGPAAPQPGSVVTQYPDSRADLRVHSSTDPRQPTAADDERIQQILANPDTREALADPEIQTLLATLRQDPDKGQRLLQRADVSTQKKIKILVDAGLLQFQR